MNLDQERWHGLAKQLELPNAEPVFKRLCKKYTERHRKYHDASHIVACLARLDGSSHPAASDPLVEYALWFHDVIYNTLSSRNEKRSADMAVKTLVGSATSESDRVKVYDLVMATEHGGAPSDPAQQLLVDVDLSILGADRERFEWFEQQIRAEYWWVPKGRYRKARLAVLNSFAARETIFSTGEFRDLYEQNARANIAWAMDRLSA